MTKEEFMQGLNTQILIFSFKKKDGTFSYAVGTRCESLIPDYKLSGEKLVGFLGTCRNLVDSVKHHLENGADDLTGLEVATELLDVELTKLEPKQGSNTADKTGDDYVNYYDFQKKRWGKFNLESVVVPDGSFFSPLN